MARKINADMRGETMYNLNKDEKQAVLDTFGETLISEVRDRALKISMDIAMRTTANRIALERYKALEELNSAEKEAVCLYFPTVSL